MWSLSSTEAVSIINFDQLIKLVKVYNYNVTCLSGGGGGGCDTVCTYFKLQRQNVWWIDYASEN